MFQRSSERRTDRVKKSCVRKVASLLAQPLRSTSTLTSVEALRRVVPGLGGGPPYHLYATGGQPLGRQGEATEAPTLSRIYFDPEVSLIDSFPVPTCRFARAYRCRRLAEESAFGYDEMNKQTFYGLRAHLRVCWPGVICGLSLAPANSHDLRMAEE